MKTEKKADGWRIFSGVTFALLVFAEACAVFAIWHLKMLPSKYFLAFLAAVLVVTAVLGLMLRPGRRGKWLKERHGRQIVAGVIALVIMLGCAVGFFAASKVSSVIDTITSHQSVNVIMNVYVLADDPAESLDDAAGYLFGIAEAADEQLNASAVADIEEKVQATVEIRSYSTAFSMIDALYAGEVNAIILDESYVSLLGDLDGYSEFETVTRILWEFITDKPAQEQSESTVEAVKDVTQTPFLLYISGNDSRHKLLADGGSDVNILVAVNPVEKQILMVNTPRDYYVANPASGDGSRDKLSHCGRSGIDNSVEALEGLYGLSFNYYAKINFYGFKTLVDAVGGVTVYSDAAFTAGDYFIQKGENHMDGAMALAFARERKRVEGGDNGRGKNQMKIITAMIDKLSSGTALSSYPQILESLEGMFITTFSSDEIASLVKMQLSDLASWDVLSYAVTGTGGNDHCWAVNGYGYVMYPHEEKVEKASDLIRRVLAGEVLTEADLADE